MVEGSPVHLYFLRLAITRADNCPWGKSMFVEKPSQWPENTERTSSGSHQELPPIPGPYCSEEEPSREVRPPLTVEDFGAGPSEIAPKPRGLTRRGGW